MNANKNGLSLLSKPCLLVQTAHQEFASLKQSNSEANQREEVLKKLASAHDSYVEICSNLREGTKVQVQLYAWFLFNKPEVVFIYLFIFVLHFSQFYNDLTEILLKFQNKCSDIVFARKTERDELLKWVPVM